MSATPNAGRERDVSTRQAAGSANGTAAPPRGGACGRSRRGSSGGGRGGRRWAGAFAGTLLLAAGVLVGSATAADVTIALVPAAGGKAADLEARQMLWESPFGGWGLVVWPFSLSVDDEVILDYRTAGDKMLGDAAVDLKKGGDDAIDKMVGEITGKRDKVSNKELLSFNLHRKAAETVELRAGPHVLKPFGIEFTVGADGTLATRDPRVRIEAKGRRLEVLCHPVTVKTFAGSRSVMAPIQLLYDGKGLLGALGVMLGEYVHKVKNHGEGEAENLSTAPFRRLTVYLPASAPGKLYEVNGSKFEVAADGRLKVAADAQATAPDGRELQLRRPALAAKAAAPPDPQPLGVSWFNAAGELHLSCGGVSVVANPVIKGREIQVKREGGKGSDKVKEADDTSASARGAAWLPLPVAGNRTVALEGLNVGVPPANPRWPHALLIWDVAGGACWLVEAAPLAAKPGAEWSCRLKPAAGKAPVPAALKLKLEALAGAAAGGELSLKAGADGVFAGALPAAPGLWRLRVADEATPLNGHTLGLVMIGGEPAVAVSLFNFRNRGVLRRGDGLDVLWTAKLPAGQPAAEWPVVVRGAGLEAPVAKLAVPPSVAAGAASGALRLETAALAPGAYEVSIGDPRVACYPLRFRVVQKELLSDFEVSSFYPNVAPSQPYPGSPVLLYKNHAVGGAGLAPFRGDADASLDGTLAAYANAPAGPALEKFTRPTAGEVDMMAVAALGMRSMPPYPEMLSQEQCYNPKHSLPEDLAEMRRRMALVVQPCADFPGLDGFGLGWHPKVWGFWEGQPALDGHQGARNGEANQWAGARFGELMQKYHADKLPEAQKKELGRWLGARAWGAILPHAFEEWFADAYQMRPGLTAHNTKPTGWGQGGVDYPASAYAGLTHRDALDYSDYCIQAWQNFLISPLLRMGNQARQKTSIAYHSHGWRAEVIPLAFGSAGRGLTGFSLSDADSNVPLLQIFSRFGSWFTALDPLPDVAVYFNDNGGIRPALHDLARLRRPGMTVSPEDVLAGELPKYKVLLLLGVQAFELPEIEKAVRDFAAKGGVIIKDTACAKELPGIQLGFEYATKNHGAWHLNSNGEWPFAVMWDIFKGNEKTLTEVFAKTPPLPVTTPDATVIIAPLAGKDSILCFTINQTLVPNELPGRWRQYVVLPKIGELLVDKGWHIHDVLAGKAAAAKDVNGRQRVAVDFTRLEGALYLLTKREPKAAAIQAERTAPHLVRLTGWLADGSNKPLADPMPFEVTLKGPDGTALFHKFAALGPATALEVPVPAMAADAKLELVAYDLILGTTATQTMAPAPPAAVTARATPDLIGGPAKIKAFLAERKGPVTVVLDEGQEQFRPAAEQMTALLKKAGRDARLVTWDLADILPLYLRWKWQPLDLQILDSLKDGKAFTWRIGLSPWAVEKVPMDDPACGHDEYGPRLRHDADIVLFGAPDNQLAVAQLDPYLRRVPTAAYPAPGCFFVHYLFSPLQGGYDGLYLGCRDAAGAAAAVACLNALTVPATERPAPPEGKPLVARGGAPAPLENLVAGKFGTMVTAAAFTPSGKKMFLGTASYGDWFFTFNEAGERLEQRAPPVVVDLVNWYNWGRWVIRPVSETKLWLGQWNGEFLYDLDKGYLSRAPGTPSAMLPGPGDGGGPVIAGSTRLDDGRTGVTYYGGNDSVNAITKDGRLLWRFEDGEVSGNLKYSRGTFPRALSGNGRVLLVAAFGVSQAMFATGMVNPGVMGLDAATGKLLWQRPRLVLNQGKVVALDDRFVVFDDDGTAHEIVAADGRPGTGLRALTGSADWVMQVPGRNVILIVENDHVSREERTARVYLRPLDGSAARELPVPGRVTDVTFFPDGQSILVTSTRGQTLCFAGDGTPRWTAQTPAAIMLRCWPSGKTVVVGTNDGVVFFLDAADGKLVRRVDLNSTNVTTGEQFVKQKRVPDVPQLTAQAVPPPPPGPSYLDPQVLDPKKVPFGPNLAPPDAVRKHLQPADATAALAAYVAAPSKPGYLGTLTGPLSLTVNVEAGRTYLVEYLNAVAKAADGQPGLRFEIAVTGKGMAVAKNLPVTIRMALEPGLARRRTAFRADAAGTVTLTMRAVVPVTVGEGKNARTTIEPAKIPVLLGDVVVAAIRFPGRNVLFDAGPDSRANPAGKLTTTGYPWENGANNEKKPFHDPQTALRLVNGLIANQETAWGGAGGVEAMDVAVTFDKPQALTAVVIYEDMGGPERTALRYSVSICDTKGQWTTLGVVTNNTQTINIFPCPAGEFTQISYGRTGHHDWASQARTDGAIRTAQIEAYASGDALDVEDILKPDDGLQLE